MRFAATAVGRPGCSLSRLEIGSYVDYNQSRIIDPLVGPKSTLDHDVVVTSYWETSYAHQRETLFFEMRDQLLTATSGAGGVSELVSRQHVTSRRVSH